MPAAPGHEEPSADEIRDELSRILASADFAASRQLSLFLQYVVEESLAGRADSIKQRNVAVHALKRDASYNPRTDPIVRLVAGKLRRALARFYDGDGARNSVRIGVPKGAYRPRFTKAGATQSSPSSSIVSGPDSTQPDSRRTRHPSVAVAPFVLLALLKLALRDYEGGFYSTLEGQIVLGVAIVFSGLAYLLSQKIAKAGLDLDTQGAAQ